MDKILGFITGGLVAPYYLALSYLQSDIHIYRKMGNLLFPPMLAISCVVVFTTFILYRCLNPKYISLTNGLKHGLWIWIPLMLLRVCWPVLAPLK